MHSRQWHDAATLFPFTFFGSAAASRSAIVSALMSDRARAIVKMWIVRRGQNVSGRRVNADDPELKIWFRVRTPRHFLGGLLCTVIAFEAATRSRPVFARCRHFGTLPPRSTTLQGSTARRTPRLCLHADKQRSQNTRLGGRDHANGIGERAISEQTPRRYS